MDRNDIIPAWISAIPRILARLWDELGGTLPVDCRWIVWVFGGWHAGEEQWCRAAFAHAAVPGRPVDSAPDVS